MGSSWPLYTNFTNMDVDEVDEVEEESGEETCEISTENECSSPKNESNKGVKRKSEFQVVYCSICKISLNSSTQATAHYSGKSHQHKVRSSTPVSTETSTTDSAPVFSPPPAVSIPPPAVPPPPAEPMKCGLCHRSFNSQSQLHAHMTGKAHQILAKSKLDSFGIATTLPAEAPVIGSSVGSATTDVQGPLASFGSNLTRVYHCAKCNITLNSPKQMEQHNKGLRHKIVIGKAKPPVVAGEKWENVRFMKISNAVLGTNKDTLTGSGGGMNLRQFYCEKCDLTVNSQVQLDQHLKSQKHIMRGLESASGTYNRKQGGGAIGRVGRLAGQGYHYNNKQTYYGAARHKVTKPYLPPLSTNFIRGSKPLYDSGLYTEHENLHILGAFGADDVSQNWNSNFIYDAAPQNLAMY